MRAVIHRANVKIEFTGRGQIWNEILRPYLGGPEAPPEPVVSPRVTAAQPAGFSPPRVAAPSPIVQSAPAAYATAASVGAGAPAARPPSSQPRTWYPPRPLTPQRFEPRYPVAPTDDDEAGEAVRVEPSADPATLYARLVAIPGRRSERDAVLAAVWFLTKGEREATTDEVERHFDALGVFADLKVVPSLLKHVHRTKMLEQGSTAKAVRLSKKGVAGVLGRLVPN